MKHIEITFKMEPSKSTDFRDEFEKRSIERAFVRSLIDFLHDNMDEYALRVQPEYTDSESRITINAKIKEKDDE